MMEDPYPASDFDEWASFYDSSVADEKGFPFENFYSILDRIVELAAPSPGMKVLDLGAGTGLLSERFAALGCNLWCTDFSSAMLDQARQRLPQAQFNLHDLRQPWQGWQWRFDRIVSSYVFHHFEDSRKVEIILDFLQSRLAPGGRMVLADISFETPASWDAARLKAGEDWNDELYWTASSILPALSAQGVRAAYEQITDWVGIYTIQPADNQGVR